MTDDSEFLRGRLSRSRDLEPDPLGLGGLPGGSAKMLNGSSDRPWERSLEGRGGRLFRGAFCGGFSGRGGAGRIPLALGAAFKERFSCLFKRRVRSVLLIFANEIPRGIGGAYEKIACVLRHVGLVGQ
jgi:hypothetical protein